MFAFVIYSFCTHCELIINSNVFQILSIYLLYLHINLYVSIYFLIQVYTILKSKVYLVHISSALGDLLFKLYFTKCTLKVLSFEMLYSFQNV